METDWEDRVAAVWAAAEATTPEAMLDAMRALVEERPADDPDAPYEWASVHDYLGRETEAIPLYRAALDSGLSEPRRAQGIIQLASSLRNTGDPIAAIELLEDQSADTTTGDAARAFLALALRDAGRPDEALRVALKALARSLPLYSSAIESYADELVSRPLTHGEE
ncbi:tetratricopeptide repeat protein [Janibacter terrae]|uniref:Tetratricopeptide repeat protein n=1 Tax=Janibacter terrae TaxID=103817 RepID=A0ABZ2FGW5_9MICO